MPNEFYRFYHRSEKFACPDLDGLGPRPSIYKYVYISYLSVPSPGQRSEHVRDDPEDTNSPEETHLEDGGSRRERTLDPGEGEVVRRTETHPRQTAGPRGRRAAADLPADTEGEDKADEGTGGG